MAMTRRSLLGSVIALVSARFGWATRTVYRWNLYDATIQPVIMPLPPPANWIWIWTGVEWEPREVLDLPPNYDAVIATRTMSVDEFKQQYS